MNDYIDKLSYSLSYCSIDEAVKRIMKTGAGSLLAKLDIKNAFRLIPVRRQDWNLLGFMMHGKYYFDVVLPFGCRSSPFLFCLISDAVHWLVENKTKTDSKLHYVEDFLLIGKAKSSQWQNSVESFQDICGQLGVPLAMEKAEGLATKLVFMGIKINSESFTPSIPAQEVNELITLINGWKEKICCAKTELQSLIGSLQFASKCIPAGRLFSRKLIHHLPDVSKNSTIVLDADFFADLSWWSEFLIKWNGTADFLSPNWDLPDVLQLFTDASASLGYGAFLDGAWFNGSWSPDILSRIPCIEWFEMVPIYLVCVLWGHRLSAKRIIFNCDNLSVCGAWEKLGSKNKSILELMRRSLMLAAKNNFCFSKA